MTKTHDNSLSTMGYFVSAPWRSSGKTMVTTGLAAVATQQHITVQTFKKGPDYIDPRWLAAASRQPCYNLDLHQQDSHELIDTYRVHAQHSQLCLVEGTMGLHDGVASDGSDSNGAVARLLDLPIILVVDCRGMHRTVAALLKGVQEFDPALTFAGVILNRIRSDRHLHKIEQAISQYTDLHLLGALPERHDIVIAEQELGLTPAPEESQASTRIDAISTVVKEHVDLEAILPSVPRSVETNSGLTAINTVSERHKPRLRIGVAHDEAFHFYYQDDLDYFASLGVELVRCSPCRDEFPAGLDGFWIGGGFPERYAELLASNTVFLTALRAEIQAGLPVHAECAGLMYLCRNVQMGKQQWAMCRIIEADVTMNERPVGRGYMRLATNDIPEVALVAHEFHHASIHFDETPDFAYRVTRGYGIDGTHDGVVVHNVIASFAHFRHSQKTPWIDWFLERIETRKRNPVYQHV